MYLKLSRSVNRTPNFFRLYQNLLLISFPNIWGLVCLLMDQERFFLNAFYAFKSQRGSNIYVESLEVSNSFPFTVFHRVSNNKDRKPRSFFSVSKSIGLLNFPDFIALPIGHLPVQRLFLFSSMCLRMLLRQYFPTTSFALNPVSVLLICFRTIFIFQG